MKQQRVLSGIKATGVHLGNWMGAIQPALDLACEPNFESYFFIANYHALNAVQDAHKLKTITYEVAATWLALGLDPKKTVLYRQSDIPEIFELSVVLSAITPKGLMNRAHAYKAKVQENESKNIEDVDDGVNMGLYTYPILMTADILALNAHRIPVGPDQVQHLEIARDIAQKFNHIYGKQKQGDFLFNLPEFHLNTRTQKNLLPGLDGRKMSASYNNHIPVFLPEKQLRKMIMKIVSDSTPPEAPKSIENNVLFDFYKFFATDEQIKEMTQRYAQGIAWGTVKQEIFEILNARLQEPRKVYDHYMSHLDELESVLQDGAQRAREQAREVLKGVRQAIGV
ncbi:MAG: tryptophan--tRNA ligase [Bdellovibrionaceae bacterium]|nr:tryptophan--tRNA ligase [Pseudobdellovibrionaceae bacterium]